MTLKRQNYAQVIVKATQSDARFIARFLNSELGRDIREASKSGVTIPKLNTSGLRELPILVPALATQHNILNVAAKIAEQGNTIFGLQNDLDAMRRELWDAPVQCDAVSSRLDDFARRLAQGAAPHAAATLDEWFETLPFPLASILRAWQATSSRDFKSKYEHLLHFFEALAEFLSVVYLSAFAAQQEVFAIHRVHLREALAKQHLSLRRASFGSWKAVAEYFSKQTRDLLAGDAEKRALCAELFADPTYGLPEMVSRKELVAILGRVNKMRNDWTGHGGVVSKTDAQLRHEQVLRELQMLRDAMEDGWSGVKLVRCMQCRPRNGGFDNDMSVLVGSNSEFLSTSRSMASWLDVERLYLISSYAGRALLLLPLVRVGPSPESTKNACYFYNRADNEGAKFISYHYLDQPELRDSSTDTVSVVDFLADIDAGHDH